MTASPNPYQIQGIPFNLVEHFWNFAVPYIKRALDHTTGEFSPEDFKQSCLNRNMQLWLISRGTRIVGAGTTEIIIYPRRKHCRIITLAGANFPEWAEFTNEIIAAWAKSQGCVAVEAFTRKGFVPKLTALGYKHKNSVLIKEI